jgi:acyl-CoA dehydrogenase
VDFRPDQADEDFRRNLRQGLARIRTSLRAQGFVREGPRHTFDPAEIRAWTQALDAHCWVAPSWPKEHGGLDWRPSWRGIRDKELAVAGCPGLDGIGIDLVGPVICSHGSVEQKQRYLPRIRRAEDFWCQGFSEPNAGSDLLSLKTTAVKNGDAYVVDGRKIWISNAHHANMMFTLVRTSSGPGEGHAGVSFLLINMRSRGVDIRPIVSIDEQHRMNEVTLDNVRVPVGNLVGEEGKGWLYARQLLQRERTSVAYVARARWQIERLKNALSTSSPCGQTSIDHPHYRLKLAEAEVELRALESLETCVGHISDDDPRRGLLASILKLRASESRQRVSEVLLDVIGDPGLQSPGESGDVPPDFKNVFGIPDDIRELIVSHLYLRSATIVGGTSEIQRNLIAGIVLAQAAGE